MEGRRFDLYRGLPRVPLKSSHGSHDFVHLDSNLKSTSSGKGGTFLYKLESLSHNQYETNNPRS